MGPKVASNQLLNGYFWIGLSESIGVVYYDEN